MLADETDAEARERERLEREWMDQETEEGRQRYIDNGLDPDLYKPIFIRQLEPGQSVYIPASRKHRTAATQEEISRLGITNIPVGVDAGNLSAAEIKAIVKRAGNDPKRIRDAVRIERLKQMENKEK